MVALGNLSKYPWSLLLPHRALDSSQPEVGGHHAHPNDGVVAAGVDKSLAAPGQVDRAVQSGQPIVWPDCAVLVAVVVVAIRCH